MSRHREKFKDILNTGFGPQSAVEGGRLMNKRGETNVRKTGIRFWEGTSIYHLLLRMNTGKFLLIIFLFYTCVNILFASVYFAIGVNHLAGAELDGSLAYQFMEAFFFSSQTLTTVGYGHVAPIGLPANVVASIESLIGILSFAVVTGLIYGRFSRPRAYIRFSDNLLIAPYRGGRALMFRIATYKNNYLTDVEANVTIALHENLHGKRITKFYQLPLEMSKINSLALSWTIVHPMNEDSPLNGYTFDDFQNQKMELIVNIKAFDDQFSNLVQQRSSFTNHELIDGAKFLPMFRKGEAGVYTILELHKINAFERVELPESIPA